MKILRLLNKKIFPIVLILFLSSKVFAEDKPVDIWNIDKNENNNQIEEIDEENEKELKEVKELDVFKMQNQKQLSVIKLDNTLDSQKINIYGYYSTQIVNNNYDILPKLLEQGRLTKQNSPNGLMFDKKGGV